MKYVVAAIAFTLLIAPAILQLWRRRGSFNGRHLAFFAALLLLSLGVIAVFWPHTQGGGEVAGWGGLAALFVIIGAGALGAFGAVGLIVVAVLMMAGPPDARPPLRSPAGVTPRPRRNPPLSPAATTADEASADTGADWTAPSRVVRRDDTGEAPQQDAPQPWYAMVAGVAATGIVCVLMWLYIGFSLKQGQLTLPLGRSHDYTLTGPTAWMVSMALVLLTLALLAHVLRFVDEPRARRYGAWSRHCRVAAVAVLVLTLLWQVVQRMI